MAGAPNPRYRDRRRGEKDRRKPPERHFPEYAMNTRVWPLDRREEIRRAPKIEQVIKDKIVVSSAEAEALRQRGYKPVRITPQDDIYPLLTPVQRKQELYYIPQRRTLE